MFSRETDPVGYPNGDRWCLSEEIYYRNYGLCSLGGWEGPWLAGRKLENPEGQWYNSIQVWRPENNRPADGLSTSLSGKVWEPGTLRSEGESWRRQLKWERPFAFLLLFVPLGPSMDWMLVTHMDESTCFSQAHACGTLIKRQPQRPSQNCYLTSYLGSVKLNMKLIIIEWGFPYWSYCPQAHIKNTALPPVLCDGAVIQVIYYSHHHLPVTLVGAGWHLCPNAANSCAGWWCWILRGMEPSGPSQEFETGNKGRMIILFKQK